MDNLRLYNIARQVPKNAKRTIEGGRLSGYTDINPMWRIKKLTELFGPCGQGWKYTILDLWLCNGANSEIAAFAKIELSYKIGDKWSEPIPGIGGSAFVAKERGGLYTSDECYKMALTDAISVACKAIGIGADIYYANDSSKYQADKESIPRCARCGGEIKAWGKYSAEEIATKSQKAYGEVICGDCLERMKREGTAR